MKKVHDDYVELTYQYDNNFLKEQDERLKNTDKDTVLATQICIQHIGNLIKKLSK